MGKKAVVIGAGFAGLASACFLAKDGYEVTVVEKNKGLGGRARVFEAKGFRFDMGPSWYLMPEVFEHFFGVFGKKPEDYYSLKKLDPGYRMWFSEGEELDISADMTKNEKLFDGIEKDGGSKLRAYLADAKYKYETAMERFVRRSYNDWHNLLIPQLFIDGVRLRILENIEGHVNRYFESDKARKILEYSIVFLGGSPKNTPSLFSMISHTDFTQGVYYPMGGIGEVISGMVKLGKELGVKYVGGEEVTEIIVTDGKAVGVKTKNKVFEADVVVANGDYVHVETKLLEKQYQSYDEKYWESRIVAPSAFILYLGVKKKIKGLTHHNVFVQHDWKKHFDEIFEDPKWPTAPSYYVSCPSKTDPIVAPKGSENLFVLVPVASGLSEDEESKKAYRDMILSDLQERIGVEFEKDIVYEKIFSVSDFAADYNAYKGTALGLSHSFWQTAYFRPHQKSSKVSNLYFAGQFTHPGIGTQMALISGEIAATLVKEDEHKA